jgi:hypothetical protein
MGWREMLGLSSELENKAVEVDDGFEGPATVAPVVALVAPSSDPDWIIVKRHIRERLIAQRRALESRGLSHSETEGHRHAIFELEGVLNCLNPSKMQASQSE